MLAGRQNHETIFLLPGVPFPCLKRADFHLAAGPCPCCVECWRVGATLSRADEALPGAADIAALNASFSPDEAPGAASREVQGLRVDHHRALGIGLLKGSRGGLFLMSEVPLYDPGRCVARGACMKRELN